MNKCPVCGTEMNLLFNSYYCPNDCDRKPTIYSPVDTVVSGGTLSPDSVTYTINGVSSGPVTPAPLPQPVVHQMPVGSNGLYARIEREVADWIYSYSNVSWQISSPSHIQMFLTVCEFQNNGPSYLMQEIERQLSLGTYTNTMRKPYTIKFEKDQNRAADLWKKNFNQMTQFYSEYSFINYTYMELEGLVPLFSVVQAKSKDHNGQIVDGYLVTLVVS